MDKVKTEGVSTKENNNKKMQIFQNMPEKKLKIRFKNFEEETNLLEPEKESFLFKNLKYKNKTSSREEQPVQGSATKKNSNSCGKRGIPNIGNTCYMYS